MKPGDLIRFKGSWANGNHLPRVGVVTDVMYNGITKKPSRADILWEDGTHGNIMASSLDVINEAR